MSPEEFEKKLQELLKSAPEGSTMFVTYSNDRNKRPCIYHVAGMPSAVSADLAQFSASDNHVFKIISVSQMALSEITKTHSNIN